MDFKKLINEIVVCLRFEGDALIAWAAIQLQRVVSLS